LELLESAVHLELLGLQAYKVLVVLVLQVSVGHPELLEHLELQG
jgi:hypothetical protein